ncbi:hypothetical protein AJ79_07355 [Helicocarpus griseus UAMH5409]|uniref:NodB homology domain-containing protein n=1 Tax=Helicocarpus griseus UAMH5409 TaxID=1447875 RepID=A0A2B7X3T5_9EURO|nr:hypothetical protein AJ79_07355 [Helicocarpus griseus UAMH5409]
MRAAIISSLLTLASAATIPAELQARQGGGVITSCSQPGVIALTYDDGPHTNTNTLLQKLEAAGAKATFFPTGTLYGCIYNNAAALKAAYDAGHQIGSHTWTHANLQNLGDAGIRDEMTKLENAFANILGVKPNYMRPPNGATGGSVIPTVSGMGYKIVTWDVDSGDWNNTPPQQSLQNLQNAGASGNGHIMLMHETVASTVNTLTDMVIDWATQNNLRMVTVAECMGDAGGEYSQSTGGDGSSSC